MLAPVMRWPEEVISESTPIRREAYNPVGETYDRYKAERNCKR